MEVERGGPVLYAVDLDGTLLSDDARLSPTSRALLLPLVEEGMPIAVASARSVVAIRKLLAGLPLALPAIEFNGAFLSEVSTGRHLWTCALPAEVAAAILDLARTAGQSPFVSTFDGERDRLYAPPSLNPGMDWYLGERRAAADERLTPVADAAAALADEIVCFTVIGEEAALRDLEGEVRARWDGRVQLHCQENRYFPGWFWLTVHDHQATKDQAVQRLLAHLGWEGAEVVACGDAENDLGLFALADRAVAVANALPALKEQAHEVIGPNTEDSVARWLAAEWNARGAGRRGA